MFTGIIEQLGTIKTIGANKLEIAAAYDDIKIGESIAVNGICLTVTACQAGVLTFDYSPRTDSITTLAAQKPGAKVNLERALQLSSRLGGHIVTGHVDCTATISAIKKEGDFYKFTFAAPADITRYIAPRGSIAIDGVSLTVGAASGNNFDISIIPQTIRATTLAAAKPGQAVNIECDILAKYTGRLLASAAAPQSKLNENFLKEHGF